ncbi:hypothetical protein TRL7639_01679 [Falsiruegeria litorea R37]|uniref:Methyltransferase n=1 Tax=Falsiruegeria litorea R37 TaxID=1200284 RepID=A0A1Y5S9L3_9RHOB|nr:CmcJ/NvfI family oxidoreductase [Falsiruegeria litorea]SLN35538.1 hypothetical protein TRL7639_01679 [Falsiruegeria litorea R37]
MTKAATVNYHVHAPERQAYHIDAGGVAGELISPKHAATQVKLKDVRAGASVSFASDSVGFCNAPSKVRAFDDSRAWQAVYDQELTALLTRNIGAKEVIVFDHTVRVDDPNATRKPARNVHSDYSPEGAQQRLVDILGDQKAREWADGHYGFINVWRPIENPINSAPLGFVRPSSVPDEDWVLLDLIYPDRRGHIMGLVANLDHEWIYQSRMTPDEVVAFNIYDNRGKPSIAHSALDMIEDEAIITKRKSIESRTLVRY